MERHIHQIFGFFTAVAMLALVTANTSRGADGMAERYRMARYYECCYGPNGYAQRMNWGRTGYCCGCQEPEKGCHLCKHCCCGHCLVPGSEPPCKCLDICLYHIIYPMSPWYSNPRDGVLYPAFGSKSPTCVPQND